MPSGPVPKDLVIEKVPDGDAGRNGARVRATYRDGGGGAERESGENLNRLQKSAR